MDWIWIVVIIICKRPRWDTSGIFLYPTLAALVPEF